MVTISTSAYLAKFVILKKKSTHLETKQNLSSRNGQGQHLGTKMCYYLFSEILGKEDNYTRKKVRWTVLCLKSEKK